MSEVKLAPSERVLEFLGGGLARPAAAFPASLSMEEGELLATERREESVWGAGG